MTYDFFVLPAEHAGDLEDALAHYEGAPERGPLTEGGPVDRFVASLDGALAPRAGDAGCEVHTSWDDPMANLSRVAGLARPHGLAVLDLQLGAVYDPRGALDVALQTEAGPQLPYLTRTVLSLVMWHIGEGRYHWVNLSRGPADFVQSFRDEDGTWAVEHRESRGHFAARVPDAALVESLLWSWARGDGRWQSQVAFSPVEV